MGPNKPFSDKHVQERKLDEMAYDQALRELTSGSIRPGVMAKALAECDGDEAKARARYLDLAAQSIKDDLYISQRMSEEKQKSTNINSSNTNAEPLAFGLYSFLIPGLGQLIQDRTLAAIAFCLGAAVLWLIFLGWIFHIWAAADAYRFSVSTSNPVDR
jgi:hypothetical protein